MSNRKLTRDEFSEIETLVRNILAADTKADAKRDMERLQFLSGNTSSEPDPYIRNILSELKCYAEDAAGRVSDKERKVTNATDALNKLELLGVGEALNDD